MIGKTIQKRYKIKKELGRGGMGTVYKAFDTLLKRDVAIKVLNMEGVEKENKEQLLREAQFSAQLNHPNIVTTFDVGEADGSLFIVMELVEGSSLSDYEPKDIEQSISFARGICFALEHAHDHNIVHRDLKPENVLITTGGDVKLMDFGLARPAASRLTVAGQITGTVYYMAPELIKDETYDVRADLYALGVMLYEWATGELPFEGKDPISIISQHLNEPVPAPEEKTPDIPPKLNQLIINLLEKEPNNRPASAREVIQALYVLKRPELDDIQKEFEGLRISTLGGILLENMGEPVTALASKKAEALLVYLACEGRTISREILAELLWEERSQERAMGNLRVALASLRKELGDYVIITRDTASINLGANIWLDVRELETRLDSGLIRDGVDLYKGLFLEGFFLREAREFEDWVYIERERIQRRVLDGLDMLVGIDLERGAFRSGIENGYSLLAMDPLNENAHRQMMLLLACSGQRSAALSQYETCRRALESELGLEPSAEIQEVYDSLMAGERPPGIPEVAGVEPEVRVPVGECPYRGLADLPPLFVPLTMLV